jgi:hypothetical protein
VFDWLNGWDHLKEYFGKNVDLDARIMHIGCGNSTLGPDLYENGYGACPNCTGSDLHVCRPVN